MRWTGRLLDLDVLRIAAQERGLTPDERAAVEAEDLLAGSGAPT